MKKIAILIFTAFVCCNVSTLYAQKLTKKKTEKIRKTHFEEVPFILQSPEGLRSSNADRIDFRMFPPPGNDCSTAATMSLPSTIPTCLSIQTTPPQIAATGNTGVISTLASSGVGPLPGAGCLFFPGYTPDTWYTFTLPSGAGGFVLNAITAAGSGFYGTTTYAGLTVQAYTGSSCSGLTLLGDCPDLISYERLNPATGFTHTTSGGSFYVTDDLNNITYLGLASGTTIYLRLYSYRVRWTLAGGEILQDGTPGNSFVQDNIATDISISLLPTEPSNASCSGCNPGTSITGCNLGATPEAWVGPSDDITAGGAGVICGTNNWYTVDNPVYFCVTATTANPTVQVSGIVCNGAPSVTTSAAQFAAFSSCALVGDYTGGLGGSSFLGCAAGQGTVNLVTQGVTNGQSFIVVVDGNVGDQCYWNFSPAGVLPLNLIEFKGYGKNGETQLSWKTENELDASHFVIERSKDGVSFEDLVKISAKNELINAYNWVDKSPLSGANYYRLRKVDINQTFSHSRLVLVNHSKGSFGINSLSPNPTRSSLQVEIETKSDNSITYEIFNASGIVVKSGNLNKIQGRQTAILEVEELPVGMYFLNVKQGLDFDIIRFIKN